MKNYLTEENLFEFIKDFTNDWVRDKQFKPYRFRPDFISQKLKIVIEFDGFRHYQQASVILKDLEKDKILNDLGFKIFRVPYFIQLETKISEKLIGFSLNKELSYPHGFIDKHALKPCDFCELGIIKFLNDLEKFKEIKEDILKSLMDGNVLLNLPPSLIKLIE